MEISPINPMTHRILGQSTFPPELTHLLQQAATASIYRLLTEAETEAGERDRMSDANTQEDLKRLRSENEMDAVVQGFDAHQQAATRLVDPIQAEQEPQPLLSIREDTSIPVQPDTPDIQASPSTQPLMEPIHQVSGMDRFLPAAMDATESLLQGVYRAPMITHLFAVPYGGKSLANPREATLQVTAPMAISPWTDQAHGQPYHPQAHVLLPSRKASPAPVLVRTLTVTGDRPSTQWFFAGSASTIIHPVIDLLA